MYKSIFIISLIIIITLITFANNILAESNFVDLKLNHGDVLAHHTIMNEFTNSPYNSLSISFGMQTDGSESWHDLFRNPSYGIGFYAADLGSEELGDPMAIYGFAAIPFVEYGRYKLNYEFGVGASFNFNEYHPTENEKNVAIGSKSNIFFNFNLNSNIKINQNFALLVSAGFTHFSNGYSTAPNLGINLLDLTAGVRYNFKENTETPLTKLTQKIGAYDDNEFQKHTLIINGNGGRKQDNMNIGTSYLIGGLSGIYSYSINKKHSIELSIDGFYDGSSRVRNSSDEFLEMTSLGVGIANESRFGRIGIISQVGYQIFNNIRPNEQHWIKVGVRAYLLQDIFINMNVRAWKFQARGLEWGIGYRL